MKRLRQRLGHYLGYYSSLIIFVCSLAMVYLACVYAMGGLPNRYNSFSYLPTNLKARLYQLQHLRQAEATAASSQPVALPILLYHGINSKADFNQKTEGYDVSLTNFYSQMLYLKNQGYNTITTTQLADYVAGRAPLPPNPIMITFDDGQKTSYYASRIILESFGMKAVMFDIVGASFNHPGNYYLTKAELRDMMRSGNWDIQAHGYDGHVMVDVAPGQVGSFYGNKIWDQASGQLESDASYDARVSRDLTKAASALEAELGTKVNSFAYPYGDIGENSANYPAAEGVLLTASQQKYQFGYIQWWPSRGYSQNLIKPGMRTFLLKRLTMGPDWSTQKLSQALQIGKISQLPYQYTAASADNQINLWGDVQADAGGLVLKATGQSSGAGVILDGTTGWQNFKLSAALEDNNNTNVSVVLRYVDSNNFASCSFDKRAMAVAITRAGIEHKLKTVPIKLASGPGTTNQISAATAGHSITCQADGKTVSASLPAGSLFTSGNVGLITYNPSLGKSYARLSELAASQE